MKIKNAFNRLDQKLPLTERPLKRGETIGVTLSCPIELNEASCFGFESIAATVTAVIAPMPKKTQPVAAMATSVWKVEMSLRSVLHAFP